MADYRAYIIDEAGHIVGRIDFTAANDRAALAHAVNYADSSDVEIWEHKRIVGTVPRTQR